MALFISTHYQARNVLYHHHQALTTHVVLLTYLYKYRRESRNKRVYSASFEKSSKCLEARGLKVAYESVEKYFASIDMVFYGKCELRRGQQPGAMAYRQLRIKRIKAWQFCGLPA